MPKRSSNANVSSQRSVATRSRKRTKIEETDANSIANKSATDLIHDPKYYFEDGSVTFCVRKVLFKVHASLLKAHSENFFKELNLSPQTSDSKAPGGTCDENAIAIPDIQPSQFRHLMKLIYCLPSNNVFFTQPTPSDNKVVVGDFECYLDAAILSRKFGMEAVQQWAKKKLGELAHSSGKSLVDEFEDFCGKTASGDNSRLGDDGPRPDSEVDGVLPATNFHAYRCVEAVQYARAVSDNALFHDVLSSLECYCVCPDFDVGALLSFLRIPNLRQTDPSLFGFLFLLLLCRGNQVWMEKIFTQEDRMALFSAQSFLTPLPKSLKESIVVPLFTRPVRANDLAAILSDDTECHREIFYHWERIFSVGYYEDVNNREFSVLVSALITLPSRRLDFAVRLRRVKCQQCRRKILEQLDQDMQEVFARLAEYYKAYD
ncbi:hypothetical protein FRC11_012474 [Ceratobasidium sp. 423]|nr:hypothetical protein FRC11_012474 [Ceratobasidium sp. 423]